MLTGGRPFTAPHFAAQARQHIDDPPPRASERDTTLPPAVDDVLARGMAKEPADRYPSAAAFVAALEAALDGQPTARTPPLAMPVAAEPATAVTTPRRVAPAIVSRAGAAPPRSRPPVTTPPRTPGRRGNGRAVVLLALLVAAIGVAAVLAAALGGSGSAPRTSGHRPARRRTPRRRRPRPRLTATGPRAPPAPRPHPPRQRDLDGHCLRTCGRRQPERVPAAAPRPPGAGQRQLPGRDRRRPARPGRGRPVQSHLRIRPV